MSEVPKVASEVEHLFEALDQDGPMVGIVLSAEAERPILDPAVEELETRGISFEVRVLPPHRDPRGVAEYASTAVLRGLRVIICAGSRSASLPGIVAAYTELPVIGVPIRSQDLERHGRAALDRAAAARSARRLHGDQRLAQRGDLRGQDPRAGLGRARAARLTAAPRRQRLQMSRTPCVRWSLALPSGSAIRPSTTIGEFQWPDARGERPDGLRAAGR